MRQTRYRLVGYVCDHSCVKLHKGEGTMTFQQIFIARPDSCRYAVMERLDTHDYVVVDLYSAVVEIPQRTPTHHYNIVDFDNVLSRIYPSEDAAIAATVLSYKES